MADNVGYTPGTGATVAADEIGGVLHQRVKIGVGVDGTAVDVSTANPMPVSITGSIPVTVASALEITNDAGNPIPVNGSVNIGNFPATQAVSAAALPLPTGAATSALQSTGNTTLSAIDTKLGGTLAVSGPLTDAQLRASPIPVSGSFSVSGGLTDAELRASPVPMSLASVPLPTGAATETTLNTIASVVKAEDSAGADGDLGFVILAQRRDSDTSAAGSDGDYATLKMDEAGRLKVAVQPASYATTTGSISAVNGQVALNVSRVSNVMIQMRVPSAVSGQNCTFEASLNSTNGTDGNWITVQAVRSNANTIETATGALSATPVYGWECSVNGMNWFRVRATAHVSGSAEWIIQPAPYATEPIPAAQVSATQPVSGTVTANIGTGALASVTSANLAIPFILTDASSAALTITTTSSVINATFGTTYTIAIPVTAVSGTNPTLDIGLEESDDAAGVNWYRVYDFPRITATGVYRSPPLVLRGTRVRYVQTVGGTTPSFTRTITRLQSSADAPLRVSFIDRTIVPNTLNSTTPSYFVEGCADFNFMVRCTAQTTAATLTAQFSHDGTNWHTTGNTLTTAVGIAHVKVQNEQWKFARLITTAAGSGVVLGEAMIVGRA